MSPEEVIRDIEARLLTQQIEKYAFQVGLKDVDFDIDADRLTVLGVSVPFTTITQAETALRQGAIRPARFIEDDATEHQVLAFDSRPVGYSGFMDCVTHSLAISDLGLFEVGRYPAVNLASPGRYWQWFLHRQLATPNQTSVWKEKEDISWQALLDNIYQAVIGG